jgi:hypothetical protein
MLKVKVFGTNRSCNYSDVYLKEQSKTSSHQAGQLMTIWDMNRRHPKPLHHPALSTLIVMQYGFSFLLETVIYRSAVFDVFLFPVSAFVCLCLLLIQEFPFSNCDIVVWLFAGYFEQVACTVLFSMSLVSILLF